MFRTRLRFKRPSLKRVFKLMGTATLFGSFISYIFIELTIPKDSPQSIITREHKGHGRNCSLRLGRNINDTGIEEEVPSDLGLINVDVWTKICSLNFNSLKQFPLFPHFPTEKREIKITDSISYDLKEKFTALRMMGYIHPPKTGFYTFYLKSPVLAQLWFSTNQPKHAVKIAHTTRNQVNKKAFDINRIKAFSETVHLKEGNKYYFEILQVINDPLSQPGSLVLFWMMPDTLYFTKITGNQVSKYTNNTAIYRTPDSLTTDRSLPVMEISNAEDQAVAVHFPLDKRRANLSRKPRFSLRPHINDSEVMHFDFSSKEYHRDNVDELSYNFKHRDEILGAFESCIYDSQFNRTAKVVKRNDGVWVTYFLEVFPVDESDMIRTVFPKDGKFQRDKANLVINEKEVVGVVKSFMEQLNENSRNKYKLNSIVNIERYIPKNSKQEKYFMELVLRRSSDKKLFRFSEYLLKEKNSSTICAPDIHWQPKVWVHVILNVRNQSGWVVFFAREMSRILKATKDEHVNFIIADYGNEGIDVAKEMTRHGLKHFRVSKTRGAFHKTSTINKAVSTIKDPNSIVFQLDLHLNMPLNIFDAVRKHTIQGKSGFAPQVMRLTACGRPKIQHLYPEGFYETMGFGIFSIYKSDWDRFGGMNEKEFKNKWGGEDWEMVDRLILHGYDVEKLRLPGFVHFNHDRTGMWNQ